LYDLIVKDKNVIHSVPAAKLVRILPAEMTDYEIHVSEWSSAANITIPELSCDYAKA